MGDRVMDTHPAAQVLPNLLLPLVVAYIWWILRRKPGPEPEPADTLTPEEKWIARMWNLLEDGCLEEAAREGGAWLREAEAGIATLGSKEARCLTTILERQLRGLPATAPVAKSFGEGLLTALRSRPATGSGVRLRTLAALGALADFDENPAAAKAYYGEAVEMAGTIENIDRSDLAYFFHRLAVACLKTGSLDEAARHSERALAVQRDVPGNERQLFHILAWTGCVRLQRGELTEARAALERAFELAEAACTEEDLVRSGAGEWLGRVLLAQGDAAAVDVLRRTVASEGRVVGPENPGLISTLRCLGQAHASAGSLPDAVAALERARSILECACPDETAQRQAIAKALARLKYEQGEFEESRRLLLELSDTAERAHPVNHAEMLPILMNLVTVSHATGDMIAERGYLERALVAAEWAHGAEAEELMPILARLGFIVWNSPDWADAREINVRLAAIQRRHLGSESPALAQTLVNQAIVTARCGKHPEAQRLLAESMDVLSETPFRPPETLGEIVARLEEFQSHPVHGGGYRELLPRARVLQRKDAGGLPLGQA
jgi:tetratricopeptide (TPR) repeat protein